jgi:WhiB family redox-sensing transcriptional regulator
MNPIWLDRGACKGLDPEIFYPITEDPDEAKQICSRCSVQIPCLEFAVTRPERHGVWGGLTARE